MKSKILIILFSLTIFSCVNNGNQRYEMDKDSLVTPKKEWQYKTSNDEMYDMEVYFARTYSDTYIDYIGVMNIVIRHRNDDGNQVFLDLNTSSFDFNGNRNYVMVRFDKGTPIKYVVRPLDSGDFGSVGFSKPNDFIKNAKSAKNILIEAPIFNESVRLFKFEMDNPLKWDY